MLNRVVNHYNKQLFRKSEMKIAQVILRDPDAVVNCSVAKLAGEAGVSEPSVIRFCTHLGCKGFPDFKIQLAQSIAQGVSFVGNNVSASDSAGELITKLFDASISTLKTTKDMLDERAVEKAIELLCQAKKIEFYGLGASGIVAQDAQHKFFRLGVPVFAHADILMQRMSAATLQSGDVLVLLSNTGRTTALIEVADIARAAGATLLGITKAGSPIAQRCDWVLEVDPQDDTLQYTPTTSRLAHLVVLDVLAAGVAFSRGSAFTKHLKRVKDALVDTRS